MTVGVVAAYHSGITVADLDRSLAFYRDLLGLEVIAERLACEEYIRRLTDAAGGCLKLTHLRVPGSEYLVELLEYQGVDRTAVGGRTDACPRFSGDLKTVRPGCASSRSRLLDGAQSRSGARWLRG
jgi:catechol 2,3-dioxygenase-like lactoylglutathione lyase family enzyme